MQVLKIDATTARREYPSASPAMKAIFDQSFPAGFFSSDPIDRIKTMSDVFVECGVDEKLFYEACERAELSEDVIGHMESKLISKAFNGDWVPNWDDSYEDKWYPWFYLNGPSGFRFGGSHYVSAVTTVGSRLCFKKKAHSDYAGVTFLHIYKKSLTA